MPRPLQVGIQLPEVERVVRWPEIVAMARAAEEVGFDSVWLGDHLVYRDAGGPERGPWDAWSMLAALAASTSRVRLGPLVACLAFHPPAMLARTAVAVDEISGGRLVLGVGAGWNPAEFRAFGLPFDRRVDRFAEAFDVVRRLVSGERVSTSGPPWRLEDAVLLPPPSRRPPLMIGSTGERMLAIALPHVDVWNTWYREIDNTIEGFEAASASVTAAARRVGRDPAEIGRSVCVLVVLDRAAAERPIDVEPVTPAGVADHLRALADAGASEAILVVSPITESSIRSLEEPLARLDR